MFKKVNEIYNLNNNEYFMEVLNNKRNIGILYLRNYYNYFPTPLLIPIYLLKILSFEIEFYIS